jgi:uncharacterized membrane protein
MSLASSGLALGFALAGTVKVHFPANAADIEQIILRWTHLAGGIIWAGLLYFFVLVNGPFQKELDPATRAKVVPLLMPRALWWFRWSSVVTVLAGFRYYMILAKTDADNAGVPGLVGRWLGLWFVVWTVAWLATYLLLKFARGPMASGWALAVPITLVVIAASWGILKLLAHPAAGNRMLAISVGGGMGYLMMLNVWGVIWRCQKKLIAWTKAGAERGTPMPAEAPSLARLAFLASRTNFWLSFPMLFFMAASAHFPFLSGQ